MESLVAGANGLAAFVGDLTYKGSLAEVEGRVRLSAQRSRLATIYADRTRLDGALSTSASGRHAFAMVGDFNADSSRLDPSMLASVTQPLAAAAGTPIGPVAGRRSAARSAAPPPTSTRLARFGSSTSPAAAAVRIDSAEVRAPSGARARIGGGDRGHLLLAGLCDADRQQHPDDRRRPADRAGDRCARTVPRRADQRPRPHRALHRPRVAAGAGPDPLRPRAGTDRPRSAPSRSSTGRSPTAACGRCASRSRAASAPAAASLSERPARSSAGITCR